MWQSALLPRSKLPVRSTSMRSIHSIPSIPSIPSIHSIHSIQGWDREEYPGLRGGDGVGRKGVDPEMGSGRVSWIHPLPGHPLPGHPLPACFVTVRFFPSSDSFHPQIPSIISFMPQADVSVVSQADVSVVCSGVSESVLCSEIPQYPNTPIPQYPNTQRMDVRMETQRMDARMATARTWMPRVCWITWICKWICQESARRKRCGRGGEFLKSFMNE